MRITNKVMQNNALANINRNKTLQDKLNTQLATGKKVARPSDDPVVAIRALRLRSDISQITQYYEKNIPDSQQWLDLTESSINTTISVVKDIVEQCEKGSSDTLEVSDRNKIIDSLKALRDEIYMTGDADYAGRYIFTGFRTDTSLSFGEQQEDKTYTITETFDASDIQNTRYITTGDLDTVTSSNYDSVAAEHADVQEYSYYRFRVAYNGLDSTAVPTLTVRDTANPYPADQSALSVGGTTITPTVETDKEAAYAAVTADGATGLAYFIPDTGELVMTKDIYDQLSNDGTEVNLTYQKSSWIADDLRPEHYFYCVAENDNGEPVEYNTNYLESSIVSPDQQIKYQIGFDQEVQVNTYASDVFIHAIGRDVDEIIDLADQLKKAESVQTTLKEMKKTENYATLDPDGTILDTSLEAAEKGVTFLRDELQKRFSNYITRSQGYLDNANEALAVIGNRSKRVELAENRLSEQQATFKELSSKNEDADATEVAVQLSSASVSYEAALMATGKMIESTLLNYL